MQNSTQSPARSQWASCSYQKLVVRPGVGVRVYTVDPGAKYRRSPQPAQLAGTTRGEIVGFSSASAQRLRRVLFELDYPEGECFGMALTSAPWVKRSPEDAFKALGEEVKRCPGLRCAVWRKEVTKKGLPHYHLVVWTSGSLVHAGDAVLLPAGTTLPILPHCPVWEWIGKRWVHHLLRDGVDRATAIREKSKAFVRWDGTRRVVPTSSDESWTWFGREALEGINLNPDTRPGKGNFVNMASVSAVQYLCDHTSKHKAYQAQTKGRAWGFWNRGRLPFLSLPGISLEECPLRLLADIRKALAKMSRYWWPDKAAPFGYRWSHPRRFTSGSKVLFRPGAPAALARLVDHAGTDADARLGRTPRRPAVDEQREGQPAAGEERRA